MDLSEYSPGAQLQSLPINDMILSFAKGIAEAQWAMDELTINKIKDMAGGDDASLLQQGFSPAFYTFEESVLEIRMEISMRVEEEIAVGVDVHVGTDQGSGGDSGGSGDAGTPDSGDAKNAAPPPADDDWGSRDAATPPASGGGSQKSPVMMSASINVDYARKYGIETSAATSVSIKLTSREAPQSLIDHFTS